MFSYRNLISRLVHASSIRVAAYVVGLVALLVGVGAGCSSAATNGTSQSGVSATCGNNIVDDPNEACDGTAMPTQVTCAFATGNPSMQGFVGCNLQCKLDATTCVGGPPGGGSPGAGGYTGAPGGFPSAGVTGQGGTILTGMGGNNTAGFNPGGAPNPGAGGFDPGAGGVNVGAGGFQPPPPGAGGAPPPPGAGGGTPAPAGNMDPVIPAVSGDCPQFVNGTITYMGLGGIQIAAGNKPATPSAPMVFYWHGTGSTSGEFAFMATAVQQGVVAEGGVLVSFQNTTGGDLLSGTSIFGAGDFKLTDQLLACAVRDHNIDPRRIFTMGCSAGGLFSAAMAAERSSYIAAAAPNSGGWVIPVTFENNHTPSLMTVHGAPGTDVVGVDFSQTSATADTAFKQRGAFVIDCNTGGGHCGGGGLAPDVWTFFKAHPFGVSPEPWSSLSTLSSTGQSQCKIQ